MIRRVVCEIDVPEDIDPHWVRDKTGINCFYDCVITSMTVYSMKALLEIFELETGSEQDKKLAMYLRKKLAITETLKIVGFVDSDKTFRTDF